MTREEYLNVLKDNLSSLSSEEQEKAIQYYSDYFEDANDDAKIMSDLGSPEKLAQSIKDKMTKEITEVKAEEDKNSESGSENLKRRATDGVLFYSYDKKDVRNLTYVFSAAEIVMISGKNFAVETRGLAKESLNVSLTAEGNLTISNNKRINFNFWSHDRKNRIVPRILLTVPENAEINRLKIGLGAGSFQTKDINIHYKDGNFEVGAGNLVLGNLNGEKTALRCGMGNLEISGELHNQTNIDCGMGSIKMNLNQNTEDCSYDLKVGLGEFRFNDDKKSGVKQVFEGGKKKNHFSVNVGMGSVNIQIKK